MNNATSGAAGQYLGPTRWYYYSGTDQLLPGYALCFDHDHATVAERRNTVEKPSFNNIDSNAFAGIVVTPPTPNSPGTYGPGMVELATPSALFGQGILYVYTDENVAAGDFLAPRADSYKLAKATMHKPIGVAVETSDRSVTNGLVGIDARVREWDTNADKISRHFDHFRNPNVPGVVAGALASHTYLMKGTTAVASLAAEDAPVGTGIGELTLVGTTTTEAQLQMIGNQHLLSAGRSLYCRQRVKIDDISDEDWFFGLSVPPTVNAGVLTGSSAIASAGTTPNATDYAGFYFDATGGNNTNINFNLRKASGTQQYQSTAIPFVNDTYIDLAFLLRNRLTGTTAGYKTAYVWVNGALVLSFETATYAAAFPDTVALSWAMAGITGGCVGTIDRLEINQHL